MVDEDTIRTACRSFIGAAFASLRDESVIPKPSFHPYIKVGRDYYGDSIGSLAERHSVERLLEQAFPERFARPPGRRYVEFGSHYVFGLLEAAAARCGMDGDYGIDSAGVQNFIDELINVLRTFEYESVCTRHVVHLTTSTNAEIRIGDVIVVPDSEGFGGLTNRIQQEIRGAARAWNGNGPRPYDPPHALLITRECGEDINPYDVDVRLSARLDRFLLLARLLTSGTVQSARPPRGPGW